MRRLILLLLPLSLVACGQEDTAPPVPAVDTAAALQAPLSFPEPVATVEGQPIGASVLQKVLQRQGNPYSRQQALDHLVVAQLKAPEAIQKGYAELPEIHDMHRRLMVERLLEQEVEAQHGAAQIPMEEIRAYYEAHHNVYNLPQLRDADHLLVKPSSKKWDIRRDADKIPAEVWDQAADWAQRIRQDIQARGEQIQDAAGFREVKARWDDKLPPELEILVEELSPAPRAQVGQPGEPGFIPAMVEEFSGPLYEMREGEISQPVRSPFGTHLIVLQKDYPPQSQPLEEAEPHIRAFLASQRREQAYQALVQRLRQQTVLLTNEELIRDTFRDKEAEP